MPGTPAAATPAGAPALAVRGLRKAFGGRPAVDDLSFEVHPGEAVALLGPNGAGKTTAMQLSLGLLDRDDGEVRLFGCDPRPAGVLRAEPPALLQARRRTGYAPDAMLFPRSLTGLEVLRLHGELLGLGKDRAAARAEEVAGQLGFAEAARRRCGGYSRGQGQRLALAQALLGEPELLLLDEPTAGLDPAGVAGLRALLARLRQGGTAILLNSHLLSEVERVCDRVLFIKGGRLLRVHAVNEGGSVAELRLANAASARARLAEAFPAGVFDGDRLRLEVASEREMPAVLRRALDAGADVLEARVAGAELEQLYLSIVEGAA